MEKSGITAETSGGFLFCAVVDDTMLLKRKPMFWNSQYDVDVMEP
jgi:hypothetical protein